MKKRILSAVLVSGVTLGTAATTVNADDYDAKIAAQDEVISNLNAEQTAAKIKLMLFNNKYHHYNLNKLN